MSVETKDKAYKTIYDYEERVRVLEIENQLLQRQTLNIQGELDNTRRELNDMRRIPLLVASISDVLGEKAIVKNSNGMSFLVKVPKDATLIPGDRVGLNQHTLAFVERLPAEKDESICAAEVIERPAFTYDVVGGLTDQIREVKEAIELPLVKPHLFQQVGIRPPSGVLLYGPPGNGKTLLAKAVAGQTNSTFIRLVGSELVRKFIGEGTRLVKEVFALAKEKAPAILFIDEIDAIGTKRLEETTGGDREVNRTLMQLLAEMDGFNENNSVKIIGATNRIDILDPALLRPGRFDRLIEVPQPDKRGREEIMKIHMRGMNTKDVDFQRIIDQSDGATGAELRAICTEAGMFAIREERGYANQTDFEKALDKVLGPEEEVGSDHIKSYR